MSPADNGTAVVADEVTVLEPVVAPPDAGNRADRRLPKRIETIQLPEPYEEFHVTAWINHPGQLREDMRSGDEAKVMAALKQIVLGHDLVDFDGQPYPAASEPAFWTQAPDDVGYAILGAIRNQYGKLPKANGAR